MRKQLFLVVDHQPKDISRLIRTIKKSFGEVDILTAQTGEEGFQIAQICQPDLVLMNVMMLDVPGYEVCRQIKDMESLKNTVVIFVVPPQTGSEVRLKALASGSDGFLKAPVDEIELIAQIKTMMRIRAAGLSEERYRLMIENLPNTIGITDASGVVQYRTPNNERLFGLKPEETIGKNGLDLVHPQDRNRMRQKLKEVLSGGDGFTLTDEFKFVRQDGIEMIVRLTGKNFINNPLIQGILISYKDISEEKQMEYSLKESDERFRSMISSMDDVVFTLDAEQRHTGVFGQWVRKSNLTEVIFIGKTAREIFGPADAAIHEENNMQALAGNSVVYEWTNQSEDGNTYFQTSLSPMFDINGVVCGIVGIGRDITKLKILKTNWKNRKINIAGLKKWGTSDTGHMIL